MTTKHIIYLSRFLGFVLVCVVAYARGISPGELAWGLYVSSMVAGSVALVLPLWLLLFVPGLERRLFPKFPTVEFTGAGRFFAGLFLALVLAGPFLCFMALFTPFLVENVPAPGMPAGAGWWPAYWVWALREFWLVVAIFTGFSLYESSLHIFRGSPMPFARPWMMVLKMFAIVVLANFGFGAWSIVPLVALLQLPEESMMEKIEAFGHRAVRTDSG